MPKSECGGCGKVFSRTSGFDKHRTGPFEVVTLPNGKQKRKSGRRCMTTDEMLAAGMTYNEKMGWWTISDPSIFQREGEAAD